MTREVRVDEARAIVQNSAWGVVASNLGNIIRGKMGSIASQATPTYPIFTLYTKGTVDDMRNLIQEGIRLALENDPEQRRFVETQMQMTLTESSRVSMVTVATRVRKQNVILKLLDNKRNDA